MKKKNPAVCKYYNKNGLCMKDGKKICFHPHRICEEKVKEDENERI